MAGRALNVTEVEVAVVPGAGAGSVITGREIGVDADRFKADLDAALTHTLRDASDTAGEPVTVSVVVSEAFLAPPVNRAVAGTSYILGTVSVTGSGGGVLVRPTEVQGNSDNIRLAGLPGVLTTQTVENDYRGTLRGFANTVRTAIFGAADGA